MIKKAIEFARTWKLPVAMICGVVLYVALESVTAALGMSAERETAYYVVTHFLQPTLLFAMLTLSFLKVRPSDLRLHRWHIVLLSVQAALFIVCALAAMACRETYIGRLAFESAMICFVCPTATASAVIVQKLNGSLSGIVTYIVLCNIMVTVLSPVFLPLVEPQNGMTFHIELLMIMRKVFPLLLCPLFLAFAIRYFTPSLMQILLRIRDMAFYLWLVALALAIMVTVRTIIESSIDISLLACFAAVSLACCLIQFWAGRRIGRKFFSTQEVESQAERRIEKNGVSTQEKESMECCDAVRRSEITAAQAFGQKNTIFAIWMALVFLNPLTSVVGGFYSIWHNVINAWQLKKQKDSR